MTAIARLADDARLRHQCLALDVLAVNHRALALYQRHGFREVARHGDDDIKIRMVVPAPGSPA